MAELGPVAWPPAPIRTERLVLRESEARDRPAAIELFAAPEVGTYIGGPRPRDELESAVPGAPGRRPGVFVVDLGGAMIGMITLDRRDAERPGHVRPEGGEAELGYLFLPEAQGFGYAAEARAAALGWFAGALPGEPVVLCTQTANDRAMRLAAKLGFTEVERFEESPMPGQARRAGPGPDQDSPIKEVTVAEREMPAGLNDERSLLDGWLDYYRATLLVKCEGLTGEQLINRSCEPSAMSLIGLVRHMTEMERVYGHRLADWDIGWLYCTEENEEGDLEAATAAGAAGDLETFRAHCTRTREIMAAHQLDDTFGNQNSYTLRWFYLYLIKEYARHLGHADLLRERIDGATGE